MALSLIKVCFLVPSKASRVVHPRIANAKVMTSEQIVLNIFKYLFSVNENIAIIMNTPKIVVIIEKKELTTNSCYWLCPLLGMREGQPWDCERKHDLNKLGHMVE